MDKYGKLSLKFMEKYGKLSLKSNTHLICVTVLLMNLCTYRLQSSQWKEQMMCGLSTFTPHTVLIVTILLLP